MAKKIEVDIDYLKSIGLSQKQISEIIKNSEPDYWINKLPQDDLCYELTPTITCPDLRMQGGVHSFFGEINPLHSFFNEEDAKFIQNKCLLLIEMSNFSFAVNDNWCPDWNNKDEKKYGIVLQNGQARVSENELFNLYVFGIVTKSRSLALEMLDEFKDKVELYFNKPFNSVSQIINVGHTQSFISDSGGTNITQNEITGHISNTKSDSDFIGAFEPRYENATTRKKRKTLTNSDVFLIQDMILKGVQQKEIAETLGYSQGTISRVKERIGLTMRKRKS